ncbi:hypothetical protein [Thermopetrobacter sp. TC1]|uniref:hypothetical protein n=1 Tax=Thermopetrobacter sp. TC1 TaxID=1495045 RepID=UPI00056E322E|nr:hypothetical protein [Thermopetrobacter sp. TC1]
MMKGAVMNKLIAYVMLITGILLIFYGGLCAVIYMAVFISDLMQFGIKHVFETYFDMIGWLLFLLPVAMLIAGYLSIKKSNLIFRKKE